MPGRDPLLRIALGAAALFLVIGIGLPLLGVRSFAAADLMERYEPFKSTAPTGFTPTNACASDTIDGVIPQTAEFRGRLYDGDWAAWTSLESGGFALGSVPSTAFLSPLSVPYFVLPLWMAPAYVKLLEVLACVAGMYLFLRRLGLLRSSAVLGGAVFASTGFLVVWTNWPQSRTAAFIPLLFWSIERFAQERRWTAAAPIAVVVACLIFGGFPAVTGYAFYAAVPYALLRCGYTKWRPPWRALRWLVGVGAAVGVGVALTAWQLLPFVSRLGSFELSRPQTSASHLRPITLATAAFPTAFGSCAGHTYFGPLNDIETNVFVGAAALVLVVVALVRRPPRAMPSGVRGFFVGAAVITLVLGWSGGPLLRVAQEFPVFSNNPVGRIRSVLGFFLAVLAAIGFDNLQRTRERRARRAITTELTVWVVVGVAAVFGFHRVQLATRGFHQVSSSRYVLPIVAAILTVAVVAIVSIPRLADARAGRISLRPIALGVVPALVLVEALAFVLPFWARIPVDEFYPRTPVHRFLAAHLDGQRFVATGGAMLVGTNLFYGLSTPNGHAFTEPRWKELLRAVEPRVFRTQTYSAFAGPMPLQRAQSPILDRMGVRYLVVPPSEATYGRAEPAGRDDGAISLEAGASFEAPIGRGPLRGVSLDVREALRPNDRFARIDVDVLGATGHTLAHSSRRTYDHIDPGPFVIPVAAEDVPANDNVSVRVRLVSRDGVLQLNGTRNAPGLIVIRPANDRLRLVFVDGAAVYQRLDALPKIRWASASRVIADPRTRLTALADEPSRANTVILDEPAPPGDDGPAEVVVTNDDGDRVRARVSAQGNGYLVVADAAVAGWQARVDGVRTRLVPADHALGAIHVPPGNHVVELDYHAPHARLGALVSIASLVLLVVCASVALRKRRSKGWQ